jgi:hypothetical protein
MTRAECIEAMARAIDPDAFRTLDGVDPSDESIGWLEMLRSESIEEATAAYDDLLPHIQAERERAYLAGFKASGEGWNGEWPFEGVDPSTDEDWRSSRDEALRALDIGGQDG